MNTWTNSEFRQAGREILHEVINFVSPSAHLELTETEGSMTITSPAGRRLTAHVFDNKLHIRLWEGKERLTTWEIWPDPLSDMVYTWPESRDVDWSLGDLPISEITRYASRSL